ncbi:MAG: TetR/AcrR family transcriptional regulator [Pedobacter sp.]|nr:TetR/AcrR family transcriptional regulator [Pedobacter sp.]
MKKTDPASARPARRHYGGKAAEDRSDERRRKLLAAGLELFGTQGYAATSVKALCTEAGLTERYFYESFRNREDIFMVVAGRSAAGLARQLAPLMLQAPQNVEDQVRDGLRIVFQWFRDDPRRARVQLIEPLTIGPQMTEMYRQVTGGFILMLRDMAVKWFGEALQQQKLDAQLLSTAMVGAVVEMTKAWVLEGCPQPVEEMVHNAMAIYTAFSEKLG